MAEGKQYAKVSDCCFSKTETIEVVSETTIDALLARREQYVAAKSAAVEYNDRLIAEIDADIAEAEKLSIKTQAVFEAEEAVRLASLEGTTPVE